MAYTDCLTVILISLATAAASEFISWLLIYRTDDYKSLKRQIDTLNKKRKLHPVVKAVFVSVLNQLRLRRRRLRQLAS
jgi:hypothetical protein